MSNWSVLMRRVNSAKTNSDDSSDDEGISDEEYARRARFLTVVKPWLNLNIQNKSSHEKRLFFLNCYLTSPHNYMVFKDVLNYHVFPSLKEIKEFSVNFEPGVAEDLMTLLARRMKYMPERAKYVTLDVDFMELTPEMSYDSQTDKIIGFSDIDGVRSNSIVTKAYVVFLNGCLVHYLHPLGYAFTDEEGKYSELSQWIDKVIRSLHKVGYVVCAVISHTDGLADFKEVTIEKPYFEVDGKKVFYIFDPQSIIMSIRDVLLETNLFYGDQMLVSWSDVIDVQMQHKILSEAHVNPTLKERAHWNLVSAVFHDGVGLLIEAKYHPEVNGTSVFIRLMDLLCDIITHGRTFTASAEQLTCFEAAIARFKSIKLPEDSEDEIDMSCFKNMQITLNALVQMHKQFSPTLPIFYMTKISVSPLIQFLDVITKECQGKRPTPIKFQRAFSKQMIKFIVDNSVIFRCDEDLEQCIQSGSFVTLFKDNLPQ